MVIKEVLSKVETSQNPVAKALHTGKEFRALVIAFKEAMILKDHKTNRPAKLTVLQGGVTYEQGERIEVLGTHDTVDIPVGIMHRVVANEDALCILTQG